MRVNDGADGVVATLVPGGDGGVRWEPSGDPARVALQAACRAAGARPRTSQRTIAAPPRIAGISGD